MSDLFGSPPPPGFTPEFERFWSKYPRKQGTSKIAAWNAWNRVVNPSKWVARKQPRVSPETIMRGLAVYPFNHELHLQPHAATWLNQRRWEIWENNPPKPESGPEIKLRPSKTAWMEGYEIRGRYIDAEPEGDHTYERKITGS